MSHFSLITESSNESTNKILGFGYRAILILRKYRFLMTYKRILL